MQVLVNFYLIQSKTYLAFHSTAVWGEEQGKYEKPEFTFSFSYLG